jgi:hypothetical protein
MSTRTTRVDLLERGQWVRVKETLVMRVDNLIAIKGGVLVSFTAVHHDFPDNPEKIEMSCPLDTTFEVDLIDLPGEHRCECGDRRRNHANDGSCCERCWCPVFIRDTRTSWSDDDKENRR